MLQHLYRSVQRGFYLLINKYFTGESRSEERETTGYLACERRRVFAAVAYLRMKQELKKRMLSQATRHLAES